MSSQKEWMTPARAASRPAVLEGGHRAAIAHTARLLARTDPLRRPTQYAKLLKELDHNKKSLEDFRNGREAQGISDRSEDQ